MNTITLDTFQQAIVNDCVHSSENTFISGGAGSGKSQIIKALLNVLPKKKTAYLAPTGKAALNLGTQGQTLHRFFGLDTYTLPPDYMPMSLSEVNIKALTHMVIDEISMVRGDIFNSIEHIIRHSKGNELPWGGIKVIVVGDYAQLPPVFERYDQRLYIEQNHGGLYAFQTFAWEVSNFTCFKLTQCYRQDEADLIHHLNTIRLSSDTKILQRSLNWFNTHITIRPQITDESFNICPTRKQVEMINQRLYNELEGEEVMFEAGASGFYPEDEYPAPTLIRVKQHCPVRIIKNQVDHQDKRRCHVNGDIGVVLNQVGPRLGIYQEDSDRMISVSWGQWLKYKYLELSEGSINTFTKNVIGRFTQIPIVINYAGTIHSAQGATMERVHLHLDSNFFEPGQLYVALSRCRSLAGLSMSRKLTLKDIRINNKVIQFYNGLKSEITPA